MHAMIKQKMQEKAEKEDEMQKKCEKKRERLFKEKLERFEKDNALKHEGEKRQLEKIENRFQGFFGTKVKLNAGARSGKIVIKYSSNEDLERILELISK